MSRLILIRWFKSKISWSRWGNSIFF